MADVARRASAKPSRGGVPNALFLVASAEALPAALLGRSSLLTVNYPWGSLLRTLVQPDPGALRAVVGLLQPGGRLIALLNASVTDDRDYGERLGLPPLEDAHIDERLVPGWRESGLDGVTGAGWSRTRSRAITPRGAAGSFAARTAARSWWRALGARNLARRPARARPRMPPFATCRLRAEVPRRPRAWTHRERPARRPGPRRVGEDSVPSALRRARAPPGHDDRLASAPRCHGRLGRRLPRRGLHAARPGIEHDHAAGAGDRLLDRARSLVPRRPTGPPPPRRWPPVRGEPAHAARRPSRSKGRPRRRRAPTAAAQGPRRAGRSALALHAAWTRAIAAGSPARFASRETWAASSRERRGQLDVLRAQRRAQVHVHRAGGTPRQERSRGRPATRRARLDSLARPVPATWSR